MKFSQYLKLKELSIEISEALNIIKKSVEITDDDVEIGTIKNIKVIKTPHTKDMRGNVERDANLNNQKIINIIKKSVNSVKQGYNALIYKNTSGKYDNMILHLDKSTLRIVTMIQQSRTNPNYFTKDTDNKIVVEATEFNLVIQY